MYLTLNATAKISKEIMPSLKNAISDAGLADHFIVSRRDEDKEGIEDYVIYFERRTLLTKDSSSYFELHIDNGNKVQFQVYGGSKACFATQDTEKEVSTLVQKIMQYI